MKKKIAVFVVSVLLLTACGIANDKKGEPVSSAHAAASEGLETEKKADDILTHIVSIEEISGAEGVVDETTVRKKYEDLTKHLIAEGITITTMESCTSWQIASLITDTEGASAVFKGAFVTYSNEAKIAQGVPCETIEKYGVYSAETASAMAEACRDAMHADIGIGVTGSFGNVDPNNADSTPGEAYFAIADKNGIRAYHCTMPVQPSRLSYKLYMSEVIADKLSQQG
jgi:PncC family amidohydrolase